MIVRIERAAYEGRVRPVWSACATEDRTAVKILSDRIDVFSTRIDQGHPRSVFRKSKGKGETSRPSAHNTDVW